MATTHAKTCSLLHSPHINAILNQSHSGLVVKEIAHRAGLSKSRIHWLLQTLVEEGDVTLGTDPSRYLLGLKLP